MKLRYALLAVVLAFYVVTVYLRGTLARDIEPWQLTFILWVAAHDVMAATAGYILGNIRTIESFRKLIHLRDKIQADAESRL